MTKKKKKSNKSSLKIQVKLKGLSQHSNDREKIGSLLAF